MRIPTLVLAVTIVGLVMAVPAVGALGPLSTHADSTTESNITAGERLGGVLGAQAAELEGEFNDRAFEAGLAQADDEAQQAAHLSQQLDRLEDQLETLADRRELLDQQRANGTISEGQYQAAITRIAAEQASLQRLANRTNETAMTLPAETRAAHDIDRTRIRHLQENAANLTGPEVADIAREIAGPDVGTSHGPPQDVPGGPAGDAAGNESSPPAESGEPPEENVTGGSNEQGQSPPAGNESSPNTAAAPTIEPADGSLIASVLTRLGLR